MHSTNLSTQQKAKLALVHNLYIPNWSMFVMFSHALVQPDLYRIELYMENGIPIGALALKVKSSPSKKLNNYVVAIFIEEAYRRCGIATKLLDRLGSDAKKCKAGAGISGSRSFWLQRGIKIFDTADLSKWHDTLTEIECATAQKELTCSSNRKPKATSKNSCTAMSCATA